MVVVIVAAVVDSVVVTVADLAVVVVAVAVALVAVAVALAAVVAHLVAVPVVAVAVVVVGVLVAEQLVPSRLSSSPIGTRASSLHVARKISWSPRTWFLASLFMARSALRSKLMA